MNAHRVPGKTTRANILFLSILGISLLGMLVLTCGCGQPTGIITISGSTTVWPLAQQFAALYMKENPGVSIVTAGGGSAVGIQDVSEGKVDIGMASRAITSEDPKLITHLLGRDAIAIVVYPTNPLANLNKNQLVAVFAGDITNWKDLGGQSESIHVISREQGSGTRTSFEDLVMGTKPITPNAVFRQSNQALRQAVAEDPMSIGFLSLGLLDNSVKAISVNSIPCTVENAVNGSYPIVRPLYFLTKQQPEGLVKNFIDYCQGDKGQAVMVEGGYIAK